MPLKLYKRPNGTIWHYRGEVAGRYLRGTTRTADEKTAKRILADKEAREWRCHFDGPEAVLTFSQAATIYRDAGKPTRFLSRVEDYWRDTPIRDIASGTVKQAAIEVYPRVSGATRNRQFIVPTQAIVNHAAEMELCRPLKVKRFSVVRKEREPATWAWIEAFMAAANPHLGALACFMFLTGARISEALAVTWKDVDLSARKALIRQTKVGDERRAHLPPVLVAAIANITDRSTDQVFRYSSRNTAKPQWRKAIKRAGIKPLSFHACRHGFATSMLHKGVDPITTAKRGGWKSPAHVFATYGHASEDETIVERLVDSTTTAQSNAGSEFPEQRQRVMK